MSPKSEALLSGGLVALILWTGPREVLKRSKELKQLEGSIRITRRVL